MTQRLAAVAVVPAVAVGLGVALLIRRLKCRAPPASTGIIPNLLVTDMRASLAFYCDLLGFSVIFTVDEAQGFSMGEVREGAVFASVKWDGHELMLQTVASLADDLPGCFTASSTAGRGGTFYFRGYDPAPLVSRLPNGVHVKGPDLSWYGMNELYIRDPDGHILCLGTPMGRPPK
mmetsp:Transcript_13915/g.36083  ORF Transcript_13915/g.36083 Transcript_13915/m.36083 type:complete len:176 (+) Transcript_13915:3-530(+)